MGDQLGSQHFKLQETLFIVYEAGWMGAENLALSGFRSPVSPTRSEWLHRPRYPDPYVHITEGMNLQLRDSLREKLLITAGDSISFVVFFHLGDPGV